MEDDKDKSHSKKDREMAGRFSNVDRGGGYEFFKDKDDDEEKKKKIAKKAAKKISFIGRESSVEKTEKSDIPPVENMEKKNPFKGGFLKGKEVEIDTSTEAVHDKIEAVEKPADLKEEFQEVVIDRLQEVEQELELPEAQETAEEIVADAEFLEHVGERLEEGLEPEEAIIDSLEDVYVPPDTDAKEIDLDENEFFEDAEETAAEEVSTEEEPEITKPIKQTTSAHSIPPNPPKRPLAPPPLPPTPPTPPNNPPNFNAPPPPNSPNQGPNVPPNSPNVVNNPNFAPMNDTFYRNKRTGDVLAGGILGYLWGKRRGRRKAEREMQPEIKKRDAELGELKAKLTDTEAIVRAETAKNSVEKIPEKPVETVKEVILPVEKVVERVENVPAATLEEEKQSVAEQEQEFEKQLEAIAQSDIEKLETSKPETAIETALGVALGIGAEKEPDIVAESQPEQIQSTEKLGDILEKRQEEIKTAEKQRIEVETAPERKRDIKSMSMPELLQVAEGISLEKTSLRELYERNRIDAVNLRRVVIEYMNGGTRYQEVLHNSLEAVEMQRELRGEVRHDSDFKPPTFADKTHSAQATASLLGRDAVNSVQNPSSDAISLGKQASSIINETENDRALLTNGTAIVLGVLAGIAIMVAVLLF